jgi:hypothetical protein
MDIPADCIVWAITRDEGGDFERIVIYGSIRYHLLLRWNTAEEKCLENTALRKVYDAIEGEDVAQIVEAAEGCLELIWPFVVKDHSTKGGVR